MTPQYIATHARLLKAKPRTVAAVSLRYRSDESVTLLACVASAGKLGVDETIDEARRIVAGDVDPAGSPLSAHPVALASLARAVAGRPGPGGDYSAAADLYQALRLLDPERVTAKEADRLDLQTNLASGRHDYVADVLSRVDVDDDTRWMIETDLASPVVGRPGSSEAAWLKTFNQLFERHGLTPVSLDGPGRTPFDRLSPSDVPRTADVDGPLVTIVMSVYKPDRSLLTALRSMCDQTWPHLEILMVDDCSGPDYAPLLAEAEALDPRITLLTMERNGGTYAIRNWAIARARGTFVGFQDSDDWSHPERLERQLAPLLADPTLVASLSLGVRVTDAIVTNKVGYPIVRPNASSMLFRRDVVLERLGGFDEVRKSADAEFARRLETAFGADRVHELKAPLAVIQLSTDSLSLEDFRFGWQDADRVAYRDASRHWHDLIAAGDASPFLDPAAPRPFPAPWRYLRQDPPGPQDVIVVTDVRAGQRPYAGAAAELSALADAGHRVAVEHAEAMRHGRTTRGRVDRRIEELLADGTVASYPWRDALTARLLLVRDPELLSFPRPADQVGFRPDRVVVHAAFAPSSPQHVVYDPAHVEAVVRASFGVDAEWLPATPQIANELVAAGARGTVLPPHVLGVVPVHRGRTSRGRRPVVGTSGLEAAARDRPKKAALLQLLPVSRRIDVRIHDVARAMDRIIAPADRPRTWSVTQDEPLEDFVDGLDFYIGVPRRSWGPERNHEASVAIARGVVTILDPSLEQHFGDAALYAGRRSAQDLVRRLTRRPRLYVEQQERGWAWAESQLSAHAYRTAVAKLLG